jgi:hypothetical protein
MGKVKRLELWWQLYLYVTSGSGLRKKPAITLCEFECTSNWCSWKTLLGSGVVFVQCESLQIGCRNCNTTARTVPRQRRWYSDKFRALKLKELWFDFRLRREIFIFFQNVQTGSGTPPPCLLFNGYQCPFPGVKRPGSEIDHSPPSSAEISTSGVRV